MGYTLVLLGNYRGATCGCYRSVTGPGVLQPVIWILQELHWVLPGSYRVFTGLLQGCYRFLPRADIGITRVLQRCQRCVTRVS